MVTLESMGPAATPTHVCIVLRFESHDYIERECDDEFHGFLMLSAHPMLRLAHAEAARIAVKHERYFDLPSHYCQGMHKLRMVIGDTTTLLVDWSIAW